MIEFEENPVRWPNNGLPRKGWELVDVVDLGKSPGSCEWCGTNIRYEHEIAHSAVECHSFVGCICAGHLTSDYATAKKREKRLRVYASRQYSWLQSPRWRTSEAGNVYRRDKEVLIYRKHGYWRVKVGEIWGRLEFNGLAEAKLAALRGLIDQEVV